MAPGHYSRHHHTPSVSSSEGPQVPSRHGGLGSKLRLPCSKAQHQDVWMEPLLGC